MASSSLERTYKMRLRDADVPKDRQLDSLSAATGKSKVALIDEAVSAMLSQYQYPLWPHNFHMEHDRFEMWCYQPLSGSLVRMFGVLYQEDQTQCPEHIQALVMLKDIEEVNLLTHMELCNAQWRSFKVEKREKRRAPRRQ